MCCYFGSDNVKDYCQSKINFGLWANHRAGRSVGHPNYSWGESKISENAERPVNAHTKTILKGSTREKLLKSFIITMIFVFLFLHLSINIKSHVHNKMREKMLIVYDFEAEL